MSKKDAPEVPAVKANGRLFFRPVEARGLKGKKLETYAKVYLDKEKKFKTNRIKNSADPTWSEDPRLLQLSEDTPVSLVRFAVWKKDMITRNFLGQFHFSVESLMDEVPRDRWYALESKKGEERGEIHLQVCYLPVSVDMTPEREEFTYPLHTMIRNNRFETFERIIQHIKNPESDEHSKPAVEVTWETQDSKGHTALHVAAQLDKPNFLAALLEAGCNANAVSKVDGSTPLHMAAVSGSTRCVQLLLDAGAQVGAQDLNGLMPIHVAAGSGHPEVIGLLHEKGAEISAQDKAGDTPMHHALKGNKIESIRALASRGADIFKENGNRVSSAALSGMLDFVDEHTTAAFLEAVNVVTPREFPLKKLYSHRYAVTSKGISKDWLENPQFGFFLKTETKTTLSCLMHYHDESGAQPMERAGYMVIRPKRNEFNEVTFLHDVVGYGTKEPLEVVLDNSETAAVVLPYTKSGESLPGQWTLVAYVDSADIGIEERKPFREHIKIDSAWAGATAAGCIENENWTNNPKFKLTIPEDMVDVTVLLEQERAPQDTTQFQVMPYKSHIGFYLYNDELEILVGQVQKFKNAREVSEKFQLDGRARKTYLIVPCTYRPDEEHKFSLHVFANAPVQLTPD